MSGKPQKNAAQVKGGRRAAGHPGNRGGRTNPKNPSGPTLPLAAILFLATLAVFLPALKNGFLNYDDPEYILENRPVLQGLTLDGIRWAFSTYHTANWHPLTWLSHMLDVEFFGVDPRGHHLTSLLLHCTNACLLLFVLRGMTANLWPSAFVAALFALHPLHVESVAWASERKDVLSTLFLFLTLWAYVRCCRNPRASSSALVAVFFACGLMAKPMLVTLPFALLLLDFWPLGRWSKPVAGLVLEKAPLFLLSLGSSVVTVLAHSPYGTIVGFSDIPLASRLANAALASVAYLGKTAWPSRLSGFYPHPETRVSLLLAATVCVLLLAASAGAFRYRGRLPFLFVGWFWYLGTLVPVIGLMQTGAQGMANRYTYVPLTGVFVAIAWGAPRLWRAASLRPLFLGAIGICVLSALAVATRLDLPHWRSSETLWRRALDVTSRNWVAHYVLGLTLASQQRAAEAVEQFESALTIRPGHPESHYNLGKALDNLGRQTEAMEHYQAALRTRPDYVEARNNLGISLAREGRTDEAIASFREALRLKPDHAKAHNNLGMALMDRGEVREAAREFGEALRLKPDYATARTNLQRAISRQVQGAQ